MENKYYKLDTINETIKTGNFNGRVIAKKIKEDLLELITVQQTEKKKFTDFVNSNFNEGELAGKFIEKINEKYNDELNKVITLEENNYKDKSFDIDNSIKKFFKKNIYKNINFAINKYTQEIIDYSDNKDEMIERLYGFSYADNENTIGNFKDLLKKTRFFGLFSRKGGRKSKKSKKSKKTKTRRRK